MQFFRVNYKGNFYSNRKIDFLSDLFKMPVINIDNIPKVINTFCKTEDFLDKVILHIGKVTFSLNSANEPVFEEKIINTISFDKLSFKATGNKFNEDDFLEINKDFYNNFSIFLEQIIILNDNIFHHLETNPKYLKFKVDNSLPSRILLRNFYNLIVFNFMEYEKIINSESCSILEANLKSSNFSIEEASKLSQAIGLPKFALNTIKELDLEGCLNEVKVLSKVIDGNSLKIVFEFINRLTIIFKKNVPIKERTTVMKKFISDITFILDNGYKVTDLLNYLLRQNIYFTLSGTFCFPYEEAMFLADYIKMANKYSIKIDKYPSQLKRQHDLMSKNVVTLENATDEMEKEFSKSVADYKSVEKLIQMKINSAGEEVIKEYLFLVPSRIQDIIDEGVSLHHCVSSYSDRIINKESRIVFMREKNKSKQSFITIDIDKDYNLVEAKKAFNEEVDDVNQKVIDKWLKEIKK